MSSEWNLPNPHLSISSNFPDHYYHFGLTSADIDSDNGWRTVRVVLLSGSMQRAALIAERVQSMLSGNHHDDTKHVNVQPLGSTERYALYRIGSVISVSHGIGKPSISIVMHEVSKMLNRAQAKDVRYIRIGTAGGIGVEPGTIVVADRVVDGTMQEGYDAAVLGKMERIETKVDREMALQLKACAVGEEYRQTLPCVLGGMASTDDFYLAQGRMDGALCTYTEKERLEFLKNAHDHHGIRCFEMEAAALVALGAKIGVKCAVVCCTLIERVHGGDQIRTNHEQLMHYQHNAITLVLRYVSKLLGVPGEQSEQKKEAIL